MANVKTTSKVYDQIITTLIEEKKTVTVEISNLKIDSLRRGLRRSLDRYNTLQHLLDDAPVMENISISSNEDGKVEISFKPLKPQAEIKIL